MGAAPAATDPRPTPAARVLSLPIRGWRTISVHLPPRCRFHPSCSAYALEALALHGAGRGTVLAVRRIGRCHPWHEGGLDPVPRPPVPRAAPAFRSGTEPVGAAEES